MSTLSPAVALSSSLNFPVLLSLATISAQIQLWQVFCLYLEARPPIRCIDGRKFICLGGTQENDPDTGGPAGALLFLPVAALGPLAEHLGPIPFGG
jgi:hypothetical protein